MRRFYIDSLDKNTFLEGDEAKHLFKVLRMSVGDEVELFDGSGKLAHAQIRELSAKKVYFDVLSVKDVSRPEKGVVLWVAPTKSMDRMEWMVEKAVELGVYAIYFFFGKNSERKVLKIERLERKALSACKQSKNIFIPSIKVFESWELEMKTELEAHPAYVAYCDEVDGKQLWTSFEHHGLVHVMIGPEGDFTEGEITKLKSWGVQPVSLGSSRLRTETAAVSVVAYQALKG